MEAVVLVMASVAAVAVAAAGDGSRGSTGTASAFGRRGSGRWQRRHATREDGGGGDEASRRSSASLDRSGDVGGVCGGGESRTERRGPHLLYIALCDGGPPTMVRLGAPDQGARSSPSRPLGRDRVEIELTWPPYLAGRLLRPLDHAFLLLALRS